MSVFVLSSIASGAPQQASSEQGKKLFSDPALGSNGKSCNTCHPGGKGLESAGTREDITDVVNGCITQLLKGKALDPSSGEMKSVILYLKSLGAKRTSTDRAPARGC
jgi:cytochrome c peroxidase